MAVPLISVHVKSMAASSKEDSISSQNVSKSNGITEASEGVDDNEQPFSDEDERLEREHLKTVINAFLFYKYVQLLNKINIKSFFLEFSPLDKFTRHGMTLLVSHSHINQ